MKDSIIKFFLKRHLLSNLIFFTVFIAAVFSWINIPKEELPDVTFDHVRISVHYPGASAEDVEYYVTRPIEEEVRGLDGIYYVRSSTSMGNCSVSVEIEKNYPDKDEVISEIRNAVLDVDLPDDIVDEPNVRVFKTSRKAVIDIGLFYDGKPILDVKSRKILQQYALALETKLLSLQEVSSVNRSGYLDPEIHIKIDPDKLTEYRIPFNTVINQIKQNNVRQPAGSLENEKESKVTLSGQLSTVEDLENLAVQGGFEGQVIRIKDIGDVQEDFEKTKTILKINGHEGIFLNIVKSSQTGILDAVDRVLKVAKNFSREGIEEVPIKIVALDDESFDVRNRLSLIGINGGIGFVLILISLFVFLDYRSGIWVAVGIPFTFCFTLIVSFMMGYTINNVTLAAVIIVMGMIVDDAIVVSENISRMRAQGLSLYESALKGTSFVFLPIIASILTTCVAFVPLLFFGGRFGVMVSFIPVIVTIMLVGSLFEALCILPGHITLPLNFLKSIFKKKKTSKKTYWFHSWEEAYAKFLEKVLSFRNIAFIVFIVLFIGAFTLAAVKMKFLMFPDEETRQISFSAQTPAGTSRYETAKIVQPIEDYLNQYLGKEVVGFRNQIARTRRGSAALENNFRMRVEIVPREKRKKTANQLINEWEKKVKSVANIEKVRFRKTWHGQSGESPIEILVKENNDSLRKKISDQLAETMREYPALKNVEIDRPALTPEYVVNLNRDKIRRLAISPSDIANTLRASLEGKILYDFIGDDEEVYVRLTTVEEAKDSIEKVLDIPVENESKYLVPLREIISFTEVKKPESIERDSFKRTTTIFADLNEKNKKTPLEIAKDFEENVFTKIMAKNPTTIIEFAGEVKDTRESQKDFTMATVLAIFLIYVILAVLFDSLFKPFIIMVAIPFGIVGVIIAFWLHGITEYGFFAIVGSLGLCGVVVNDAIIMISKLDADFKKHLKGKERLKNIASIAKTRLRAVILTTLTTVAGIIPTAYGWAGYDSMLAQMMLALCWGLVFATMITLVLIPCIYAAAVKQNR